MATQDGGRKRRRNDVSGRGSAGETEAWKRVERCLYTREERERRGRWGACSNGEERMVTKRWKER